MARRKTGTVLWSDDGTSCRVQVTRGRRSDGSRRRVTRTLYGVSADEAEAEAVRMAAELGASDLAGDSMTLSDFYWGLFRDTPSNRGTPRTKTTLRGYDQAMRRYVLPTLGDVRLDRIAHDMQARVVQAAGSPRNCKAVLRAVLRSAYDMGYLAEGPMRRRIVAPRHRKEQVQPWDLRGVAMAVEASRSWRPEPRAYLALGLSGLRKSEALAVRPRDLSVTTLHDFVTGEATESMTVTVRRSYNEVDGLREGTKNDHSVRSVPVFAPPRRDLMEIARSCDPEARLVDLCESHFNKEWTRALEASGLRRVPPGTLRHTSDTIALDAGVAPDLVDKMHGRTEHSSTYRNYYRPALSAMEQAARRVGETLR